jgi:hypothetical protein
MDTHIADEKLKELHVEEATVKANDRKAEAYEIDPVAEKKLLMKLDWRVVSDAVETFCITGLSLTLAFRFLCCGSFTCSPSSTERTLVCDAR